MNFKAPGFLCAATFALVAFAAPVSAEIVFLSSGSSLSVKSHRIDGDSIILTLRGGGEVTCDKSLVEKIEADEVPYPEPVKAVTVAVAQATADLHDLSLLESTPYGEIISSVSQAHGVDPMLVRALIQVESGYRPKARSHKVATFQLLPQSENIFLIYKDGWHPAEVSSDNAMSEWQWTRKVGTISFKNPKKDVTFYLDADGRSDLFTPPQQITLKVNGQPFGTFTVGTKDQTLHTLPITAAQLGSGDMTEISIEADRTFVAGGGDTRELGLRVFHAFLEPK